MNFSSFIAMRFLKSHREDRFISWITNLSVTGITIGVAAMIVVLSVINGFESELRKRFLAANAHILAYRFPSGLKNYDRWEATILKSFGEHISGTSPFVHAETMGRKDHFIHAILVRGIVPETRKRVQDLEDIVRPISSLDDLQAEVDLARAGTPLPDIPSVILGSKLSSIMQVKVGDLVELVAPQANENDPVKHMKKYRLVGIYDSGLLHYDNRLAIMSLPSAQELFSIDPEIVTGVEIGLKEPNRSIEIARDMEAQFNISIKEWQSYNRNIFEAMKTERTVIALIVALVAFVASFNILTTLFVSVTQKHRDISILKSIGATNRQILSIFIKQSTLVGALGGFWGVLLAFALSWILKNYPFIDLPEIYLLASLPVAFDWKVYLGVTLVSTLITAIAGIYPAWAATQVSPTQGLTARRSD